MFAEAALEVGFNLVVVRCRLIQNGDVNEKARAADLSLHRIVEPLKGRNYLFLKWGVWSPSRDDGKLKLTRLSVPQEALQGSQSPSRAFADVNVVRTKGREDLASSPRASEQYVQTSLTAVSIDRAKSHGQIALFGSAIAHADKNRVSLVALHVLRSEERR